MVEDDILFTKHEPACVILTLFQFLQIVSLVAQHANEILTHLRPKKIILYLLARKESANSLSDVFKVKLKRQKCGLYTREMTL